MVDQPAERALEGLVQVPEHLHSCPVADADLPVRVRNALLRNGVQTLGDLHGVSVDTLLRLPHFGRTALVGLTRFLQVASQPGVAPMREARQAELDLELSQAGPELPPRYAHLPFEVLGLSTRTTRALQDAGVETLSDVSAISREVLQRREGVGTVVLRELSRKFNGLCTGEFDPTLVTGSTLREELRALLVATGSSDVEREQRIIERTCGLIDQQPLTLESMGAELDLTRERVRQIKMRADDGVRAVLSWMPLPSLAAARRALYVSGGLARIADLAAEMCAAMPAGNYNAPSYFRWLCSMSSDPTLHVEPGSALIVGTPLGTRRYAAALRQLDGLLADHRSVAAPDAAAALAGLWPPAEEIGAGTLNAHARLLLEDRAVEVLPGRFSTSRWSRADYAEHVIAREGGSLHFQQIAARVSELTGHAYDAAGFNSLLNTDPRFVRVGAGDFALTAWGAGRYGRFDEVVERYLRERDQPAHERQICDDLLGIYTVQEATVLAMLRGKPETFLHFGGGYWGLQAVQYEVDPELEGQIARQLSRSSEPMAIDDLRRRIAFERGGTRSLPTEDVLRVLYVSPRFRRFGRTSPPRFVLRRAGDALTNSEP